MSKKNKIVSILLLLVSVFFTLYAVATVIVSVGLEYWFGFLTEGDLFFSFFRAFPMFGLVPLLSILVGFWFFYLASVAKTKLSTIFNLSLISSLILPLATIGLSWFWTGQFVNVVKEIHITKFPINLFVSFILPGFYLLVLAISLLAVLLLIRSKDEILKETPKNSNPSNRWIIAFFIFLVIPVVGLVSFSYLKAQEKDFNYTKVQATVDFHVYRPDSSTIGALENRGYYEVVDDGAYKEVQSAYGGPVLHSLVATPYGHYVYMSQHKVDDSFDVNSSIEQLIKNDKSNTSEKIDSSNINIKLAKETAVMHTKDGDLETYLIEIVTDDNVLIDISGVWLNPEPDEPLLDELVEFANSLY